MHGFEPESRFQIDNTRPKKCGPNMMTLDYLCPQTKPNITRCLGRSPSLILACFGCALSLPQHATRAHLLPWIRRAMVSGMVQKANGISSPSRIPSYDFSPLPIPTVPRTFRLSYYPSFLFTIMAPKSCRPSNGDRKDWTIVKTNPLQETPYKCEFVENGVRRLSQKDYALLQSFREEFPSLHLECKSKPCNAFMLYRTQYAEEHPLESNQQKISKDASILWNTDVHREPFIDWSNKVHYLWRRMYPCGTFPDYVKREIKIEKQKALQQFMASQGNNASSSLSKKLQGKKKVTRKKSRSNKFKHYPSPSVSDDTIFHEDSAQNSEGAGSDNEPIPEDNDKEYLPNPKASRQNRSSASASTKKKQPKQQLPTPALTARELSPSPSPSPALSNPEVHQNPPLSPCLDFHDIILAELNHNYDDDEYARLPDLQLLNALPATHDPSPSFDYSPHQIAVGYSIDEHAMNTVMDWDQADLMCEFDPVSLHPIIIDAPYPSDPDSPMADLTDDIGSRLSHPQFASCSSL
ncbi:hypothetical protein D9756_006659 [Leucocoprinus leucothites]|uniref:Uncharacterized protein n=1 Tax=Leucocoprinus leucothites TaxID=201217 RepID=A0A8H5G292_9AGAR|nr:hypothetical protein D9756_006659 [Leucoagaricus leucothites]